jgi:hypothetical protein
MDIQSATASGLQGLKNAQSDANEAALAIASANNSAVQQTQQQSTEPQTSQVNSVTPSEQVVNVNEELVELKVAEYQAKASIDVVKSADENLGTLLDVTV